MILNHAKYKIVYKLLQNIFQKFMQNTFHNFSI